MEDEIEQCTVCDGPAVLLGMLGHTQHFRCRDCGMEWSHLGSFPDRSNLVGYRKRGVKEVKNARSNT